MPTTRPGRWARSLWRNRRLGSDTPSRRTSVRPPSSWPQAPHPDPSCSRHWEEWIRFQSSPHPLGARTGLSQVRGGGGVAPCGWGRAHSAAGGWGSSPHTGQALARSHRPGHHPAAAPLAARLWGEDGQTEPGPWHLPTPVASLEPCPELGTGTGGLLDGHRIDGPRAQVRPSPPATSSSGYSGKGTSGLGHSLGPQHYLLTQIGRSPRGPVCRAPGFPRRMGTWQAAGGHSPD